MNADHPVHLPGGQQMISIRTAARSVDRLWLRVWPGCSRQAGQRGSHKTPPRQRNRITPRDFEQQTAHQSISDLRNDDSRRLVSTNPILRKLKKTKILGYWRFGVP